MSGPATGTPEARKAWFDSLAQSQIERVDAEIQKMAAAVHRLAAGADAADAGDVTARAAAIAREIHWAVWNARLDDLQAAVARAAYYQGQATVAEGPVFTPEAD